MEAQHLPLSRTAADVMQESGEDQMFPRQIQRTPLSIEAFIGKEKRWLIVVITRNAMMKVL